MSSIFIALPVALVVAIAALAAFLWAVGRDQFEDLDTPPMRMLHDDERSWRTSSNKARRR